MTDSHMLQRFLDAQDPVMEVVLAELEAGRKQTHWMWFVFPQLAGLGRSSTAQRYAIAGLEEARAYLDHPVLGPRLEQCSALLLGLEGLSAEAIFGPVDALKLRSSMTLFGQLRFQCVFDDVIGKYFGGLQDPATLELLAGSMAG